MVEDGGCYVVGSCRCPRSRPGYLPGLADALDARTNPGAPRHGQAHSGGVYETIGLPATQMETVANTSIPAHRIPMPSQNFAVVMAPHVTNNKDIVSTYANESGRQAVRHRLLPLLTHCGPTRSGLIRRVQAEADIGRSTPNGRVCPQIKFRSVSTLPP